MRINIGIIFMHLSVPITPAVYTYTLPSIMNDETITASHCLTLHFNPHKKIVTLSILVYEQQKKSQKLIMTFHYNKVSSRFQSIMLFNSAENVT